MNQERRGLNETGDLQSGVTSFSWVSIAVITSRPISIGRTFHFQTQSITEGSQGRNLKAGTDRETMKECCLQACKTKSPVPGFG